jgi:hypothetical protein
MSEHFRYRSAAYDTYRNPAEPVSAVSQILLGTLAGLVASISDVPAAIASCLLSTRSVLGDPDEHFDPYVQCQRHSIAERKKDIMEKLHANKTNKPFRHGNDKRVRHILAKFSLSGSDRPKRSLRVTKQKSPCAANRKTFKIRDAASETAFVLSIISKKTLRAIIKLPADVSLTLSKGFHNAPLTYNDHLVKPCPQVTSLWTGFQAAGKVPNILKQALFGPYFNISSRMGTGTQRQLA